MHGPTFVHREATHASEAKSRLRRRRQGPLVKGFISPAPGTRSRQGNSMKTFVKYAYRVMFAVGLFVGGSVVIGAGCGVGARAMKSGWDLVGGP